MEYSFDYAMEGGIGFALIWLIIWQINKRQGSRLNEKLNAQ